MKNKFRFEKLEAWQLARHLNATVYKFTKVFPTEERFGMIPQLRRASVSVSFNIAEGSGRNSDKDFAHFLEQAYGSLMEVASQTFLSLDLHYLSTRDAEALFQEIDSTAAKIVGLNRALNVATTKVRLK